MRIERLEIAGFKSFPEQVTLDFHSGATAVVGPNGCGKSNIADAILWVLGELGAGTIRARGKDLIFSGSALRPPLGLAEVRLQIRGVAPPVSSSGGAGRNGAAAGEDAGGSTREVLVTRRVDASGQSAYEMEGRRSTRREIRRLFAGTGLGDGSYALIEQGRAHEVLTAKPDELRLLVEEAAGLGAYRLNRRESESNLRTAERSLMQVRERLQELNRHIRQARRDSRNASRIREIASRIRLLGIAAQAARRDELLRRIRDGTAPETGLSAERARRRTSLAAFERFLDDLRGHREQSEGKLRQATRRLGELRSAGARAEALLDEGERAASLRAEQLARLDAEEIDLRDRLRRRDADLADRARRAREFPDLLERLGAAVDELASRRRAASAAERDCYRNLEETRRERDRLEAAAGAFRSSSAEHEQQRERLAAAGLALAGAQRELEARQEHARMVRSQADARRREQAQSRSRIAGQLEDAAERRDRSGARLEAARKAEEALRQERDALEARLASLKALVLSREQLGEGASRILEAARRLDLSIGDPVGETVEVASGYERAAERVLGVHRIWLDRADDLPRLVEELGGEDSVPGEVLVREFVEASGPSESGTGTREQPPPGGEWLRDQVAACAPGLAAAIPNATVVPDLETALSSFAARPALYVTRGGASVARPGVVRFGRGGPGEGFLAARREVAGLERERREFERRLEELTAVRAAAEGTAAAAGRAYEELREALVRAEGVAERLRLEYERSDDNAREVERRLEELAAEASVHAEDSRRNEEAGSRALAALDRDAGCLEKTVRALAAEEKQLASAREQFAAAEKGWREADREWTRQKAVAEELRRQTGAWERHQQEENRRLERIARDRAALARESERWKERREAALAQRAASASGTAEWEAREQRLGEIVGELGARLEETAAAARRRRAELDGVEERLAAASREVSEARSLLADLESEFRRESGLRLAEESAGLPPALRGKTREELTAELDAARGEIEALGPVNEVAEARLRELEAERSGPASRLHDVERGIADGLKAMERQDRDARRIFREGFAAVNAGFDDAFRRLFGGGRAELRLVAPRRAADAEEDPAWTENGTDSRDERPGAGRFGIEIAAEPPGKKLQSVRLLSGGEKALTALAFLIAIFRYRPAPFCLLDEVDAPLDDANVQRFVALLGELKQDTQLVVITHNRLTMEACEHLYGVTMEEPGVSRLLSVQLDDEESEEWIAGTSATAPGGSGLPAH